MKPFFSKAHFKELFEEWCQVTTCAGVIDWKMSKTVSGKIFWTMLISLGVALTIWQTCLLGKSFFTDSPYQTVLSMISTDGLHFPNIMVCNFNPLDRNKVGDVENDVLSYAFVPAAHDSYKSSFNYTDDEINDLETRWQKLKQKLKVEDLNELYLKYGYSCEEMFVRCTYETNNEFNCCGAASDIILNTGRCWKIEPEKIRAYNNQSGMKQAFAGPRFGLQLTINPKLQSYVPNIIKNTAVGQGIMVQSGFHHHIVLHNFISIQPGMFSWITLKAVANSVKTYDISLLRQNCRDNLELTILNASYSKANCVMDCWLQIEWKICHCLLLTYAKAQYRTCESLAMIKCRKENETLRKEFVNDLRECKKGCKNTCEDHWTSEMSVSSTKFISDHNIEEFSALWSDEQLSIRNSLERNETLKNMIHLNIFYSSLDYLRVETGETNPLFVSIANVGGQLSLWLGVSVVTIFQIIYYCIRCCFENEDCQNCGKRSKKL